MLSPPSAPGPSLTSVHSLLSHRRVVSGVYSLDLPSFLLSTNAMKVQEFAYDEAIYGPESFDTAESCLEFWAVLNPEGPPLPQGSQGSMFRFKKKPKGFSFDNFC